MKTMIPLLVALPLLALHTGAMATAQPAPPSGTNAAWVMPADRAVREEGQGCCNGMGGPNEEQPEIVVDHVADPAGDWRRWVAPTDANFERRYAPRPAPSLNPVTLRF
jgi:hypothetical protein